MYSMYSSVQNNARPPVMGGLKNMSGRTKIGSSLSCRMGLNLQSMPNFRFFKSDYY